MHNWEYKEEQVKIEELLKEEPTEIKPFGKFKVEDESLEQNKDKLLEKCDKTAEKQKEPIDDLFYKIKEEYDIWEYEIDISHEDIKSEVGGKEKEHSQETESKYHVLSEKKERSQEIISRSPTTDYGTRPQQNIVIEEDEINFIYIKRVTLDREEAFLINLPISAQKFNILENSQDKFDLNYHNATP
ncbi:hypothetical protein JTB14_006396 [Gonioctena quinquepunctata]|nr:hypothetical protein JTB14_006396 [Gonioctena quinquepunctata]